MGVQVLNLDRDTAGHLAVAIRLYVIRQEETGASYPHALVELRDLATDAWVAMRRQDTPSTVRFGDAVGADAYGRGDAYRVSQKQAARELGVSVRTVQRRPTAPHAWLDQSVRASPGRLMTYRRVIASRRPGSRGACGHPARCSWPGSDALPIPNTGGAR
jgi:hypothetical protein